MDARDCISRVDPVKWPSDCETLFGLEYREFDDFQDALRAYLDAEVVQWRMVI